MNKFKLFASYQFKKLGANLILSNEFWSGYDAELNVKIALWTVAPFASFEITR